MEMFVYDVECDCVKVTGCFVCGLLFVDCGVIEVCESFINVICGVHDDYGAPLVSSFDCDVGVMCEAVYSLCMWVISVRV